MHMYIGLCYARRFELGGNYDFYNFIYIHTDGLDGWTKAK